MTQLKGCHSKERADRSGGPRGQSQNRCRGENSPAAELTCSGWACEANCLFHDKEIEMRPYYVKGTTYKHIYYKERITRL